MAVRIDEDADPDGTGFWRKDHTPINRILATAISVYVATREEKVTVGELSEVFRVSPTRIIEAAESDHWMIVCGKELGSEALMLWIEHEGE